MGDVVDVVSIDYQTVYAGTPVCDIIYFIVLSTDEKFRKQYFDELLTHYYTKLEEALKRLSVDPLEAYPKEKFYSDIKKVLPFAVVLGATVLPLITAEAENVPKVGNDSDVNDFILPPNELCAQRFRGIVSDCIKWGAI
ncbi:unnamed protein product [Euphydryas editha]|uniref:Ecdysteroid 22-kinase n=1 Tax=Euphydryas editha TaxID=104508 RepID=A0AAU9TTA1_EUPED|nr:unnamed protein product [Euphydryas editha]